MNIKRWTKGKKIFRMKLVVNKGVEVNMMTLSAIRNKNKRSNSFLNTKISKIKLSQQEFNEGTQEFSNFVEPINQTTFKNYIQGVEE